LKLTIQTDEELQQLKTVKTLSNDSHMEVGIDKCAKITQDENQFNKKI